MHARWMHHFYGHEGYRDDLREAVTKLVGLLGMNHSDAADRRIRNTLQMALSHQLDWSLDDLDLEEEDLRLYL